MDLRAALSRLRTFLSREGGGRPRESLPSAEHEGKMRRPGRDYADKMRRGREDKGRIPSKPLRDVLGGPTG